MVTVGLPAGDRLVPCVDRKCAQTQSNGTSMSDESPDIVIFSDGAAKGNPGPGGWGAVVHVRAKGVVEIGAFAPNATNNQMEMQAAAEGLARCIKEDGNVAVYTDSSYLIKGITGWVFGWKKRGWKTATGSPVKNQELWERLDRLVAERRQRGFAVNWVHVPGHAGIPGNERVDTIASDFAEHKHVDLFAGRLELYTLDLDRLPTAEDIAAAKKQKKSKSKGSSSKKKAHSYLSVVGGTLRRHANWADCQRYTNGQSGALFKKSTSPDDEADIIASWKGRYSKSEL